MAIGPDGSWLVTGSNDRTVRVWDVATQECRAVLAGHTGPVRGVAVSPCGTWICSAGADSGVRVWDRSAARAVAAMRTEGPLFACAWSPDGRHLAIGGERGLYRYAFRP